jgi:hypothetical protein
MKRILFVIPLLLFSFIVRGQVIRDVVQPVIVEVVGPVTGDAVVSGLDTLTYAVYFNGTDDTLNMGTQWYGIGDTVSRVHSMSFWFRKNDFGATDEYLMHQSGVPYPGVWFYYESSDSTLRFVFEATNGADYTKTIGKIDSAVWHNVIWYSSVEKNNAVIDNYIYNGFVYDGVAVGGIRNSWVAVLQPTNYSLSLLGGRVVAVDDIRNFYHGYLADIRVWDAWPTDNKISEIWEQGPGIFGSIDSEYMFAYDVEDSAATSMVNRVNNGDVIQLDTDSLIIADIYQSRSGNNLFPTNDTIFWQGEVPSGDSTTGGFYATRAINGWDPYGTTGRTDHQSSQAYYDPSSGYIFANSGPWNHNFVFNDDYFYPRFRGFSGKGVDDHELSVYSSISDSLILLRPEHDNNNFESLVIEKDFFTPDSGKYHYDYNNTLFSDFRAVDTADFLQSYFHLRKFSDDTLYFLTRQNVSSPRKCVVLGRSTDKGHTWTRSDTLFLASNITYPARWIYPSIFEVDGSTMYAGGNFRDADGVGGGAWRSIYLMKSTDRGYNWTDMAGSAMSLPEDETSTAFVDSVGQDSVLQVTDSRVIDGIPYIMAIRGDTTTASFDLIIYKWDGNGWNEYESSPNFDNMWDHPSFVHWTGSTMYLAASQGGTGIRWSKDVTFYATEKYKFGGEQMILYSNENFISNPGGFEILDTIQDTRLEFHEEPGINTRNRYPIGVRDLPENSDYFYVMWNELYREEYWKPLDYTDDDYTIGRPRFYIHKIDDSEEELALGYSDEQISSMLAGGYIPVGNAEDLRYIDTTCATPRTFAAGTVWETSTTTTGLSDTYLQIQDIKLDSATLQDTYGSTWYDNTVGWEGVGEYNSTDFTGVYDGGNYNLDSLWINANSGDNFIGLFDAMLNGTIRNVRMDSVDITSAQTLLAYVGSLVGVSRGDTIENIRVTGTINASGQRIGGMIGDYRTNQHIIDRCSFIGSVTGDDQVGGLIGSGGSGGYDAIITNCFARATVTGDDDVGGFAGDIRYLNQSGGNDFVMNCYAASTVTGNIDVGGFSGYEDGMHYNNCYYDTASTGISQEYNSIKDLRAMNTDIMKGATRHSQVINDSAVYMSWSGYVWDFGTASDYPEFNDLAISGDPLSADFMAVWDKQNGGNPLSEELYTANEQYPAGVMLYEGVAGDSIYHIGRSTNSTIVGMCSGDGINNFVKSPLANGWFLLYTDEPPEVVDPSRLLGNTWRLIGNKYYIIYGVTLETGSQGVAYATSDSVNKYYGQHGWIIDPDDNDIGTDLNMPEVNYMGAPEFVRIGNEYHWYGHARYGSEEDWGGYFIWHGTSPVADTFNITFNKILYNSGDTDHLLSDRLIELEGQIVYYPRVYYDDGYYIMTLTIGGLTELAGQRAIYVARSTTPDGFNLAGLQRTPILEGSGANTWDELRVYCHDILKENDGYWLTPYLVNDSIRMYFSGHSYDDGTEYSPANTGIPGLATILDE